LKRHNITLEGLNTSRTFKHAEEAKKLISATNIGKKKDKEEVKRRTETRRNKKIEDYAVLGIDIGDDNLRDVISKYETAFKAAKILTKDEPDLFGGVRNILRTYILTRT
jgi:activator of 2-hydroxyglutaryl-CoA dehydratase